ncbi:MAG TPA: putative glycoside hydrolase [Anaerolineae bacterium]|nr:putative glycoside hydrolase [Anaerolineae bacterium]
MSGIGGVLNDLYIRFMVWLGAEPPAGHEHLIGVEAGPKEYTLKEGDTLFSVARKFNVHYERLAAANGLETSTVLQPDQKLIIPPANWDPSAGPLTQPQPQISQPAAPVASPEMLEPPQPSVTELAVQEIFEETPPVTPAATASTEMGAITAEPDWVQTQMEVEEADQTGVEVDQPVEIRPVELPPVEATTAEVEPVAEPATTLNQPLAPMLPFVEAESIAEPAPTIEESVAPDQAEVFRYEVQRGDTLNAIARRYGLTVDQLAAANDLADERIFPGQKLIIPSYIPPEPQLTPAPEPEPTPHLIPPPPDQFFIHTVTRGDTLNGIAKRYGVTVSDLIEINQIEHPDMLRLGQQLRIPGVGASAVSRFELIVPSPVVGSDPAFPPLGPAQAIRALYVSYFAIGHPETRQHIFDLLDTTELNAVVLDAKGDDGWITYPTQVPLAREIGADRPMVKDFDEVMGQFKARGIYTIARVVTFKDSLLAKNYPEYAVKISGAADVAANREYLSWTDPFLKPVWDYNLQLAVEAAQMGFDEIQFSHVRFPTPSQAGVLQFSQEATKETRVAAITGFLSIARGQLNPFGVKVAADTLGYTCWRKDDTLIGQDIERMAQYLDVLSPMLYPSTFGSGIPGYKFAIAHPYEVVYESAQRAVSRVAPLGCAVRPWIQDFPDYRFDKRVYGKEEIQAQIKGCFEAGCAGFMVWDHRVKYTDGAYAPVRLQV